MNNIIYPWQQSQWHLLQQAKADNRLPHALILTGIAGTGKRVFADGLVRSLLCECPAVISAAKSCDCHACRLVIGRTHPDVLWVQPENPGHAIKVDQVREINHFTHQSSMGNGWRAVVIYPAEAMNMNAANALLKTLEEPARQTLIILVCDQSGRLPATILSRCQRILLMRPDRQQAVDWLKNEINQSDIEIDLLLRQAAGAPCAAKVFFENDGLKSRQQIMALLFAVSHGQLDPVKAAASVKDVNYTDFLEMTQCYLHDLIKLQLNVDADDIINIDCLSALQTMSHQKTIQSNIQLLNLVQSLLKAVQTGINLNKQLMLESFLVRWADGLTGKAAA